MRERERAIEIEAKKGQGELYRLYSYDRTCSSLGPGSSVGSFE